MSNTAREGVGGWIGVDLDCTLATYHPGDYQTKGALFIGQPIDYMVSRVKRWLREGREVRIFTARACEGHEPTIKAIQDWTETHIGRRLAVTCVKDYDMEALWDDRAFRIEKNTGRLIRGEDQ